MYSASSKIIKCSSYTNNAQCNKKIELRLDTGETMYKNVKEYKRYKLQTIKDTQNPTAKVYSGSDGWTFNNIWLEDTSSIFRSHSR